MSRIFVSHSSADNFPAQALGDWLVSAGWDDVFLDIDRQGGIAPGERWEKRLHEAANRCEAVIFLISRSWLGSEWCAREFDLAVRLNKRLFGVVIDETPISGIPLKFRDTWQLCNLHQGTDHQLLEVSLPDGNRQTVTFSAGGLAALKAGLVKAGLDARFFPWPPEHDPDRVPYRGLAPLDADDAGIFFGREAPTVTAMDMLRGLHEAAPPRLVAILGASGAGKSSFLRAGLLPRLKRDDRAFMVMPIIRPQRATLWGETGLLASLEGALKVAGMAASRSELRKSMEAGGKTLLERFRLLGRSEGRALVLPIDQAEELFGGEAGPEAGPFLQRLRELVEDPALPLIVLLTIRSDSYDRLQNAPELDGVDPKPFNLSPLPRGAYQTVIEAPAARYAANNKKLSIDPRLTAALLAEIEQGSSKDALPLLAFTLERLFAEHGGDGDLRLEEYHEFGGLEGAINTAVNEALARARGDASKAPPPEAQLALLKRGLIPWLAGIDPATNAPRRKTARWSDIPAESQPLMELLVEARLMSTDRNASGERTVEPAHEALLRQWAVLDGWLKDDLSVLATLDGVKDAARAWAANAGDGGFMVHSGARLASAEGLNQRPDLAANLSQGERDYLAACRAVEEERRDRELRDAKKLAEAERLSAERQRQVSRAQRIGLVVVGMSLVVVVAVGIFTYLQGEYARVTAWRAVYNESIGLTLVSQIKGRLKDSTESLAFALAAWPRENDKDRPVLEATKDQILVQLPEVREARRINLPHQNSWFSGVTFSPDGKLLLVSSVSGGTTVWDCERGTQVSQIGDSTSVFLASIFSADGRLILTTDRGGLRAWDTNSGALENIVPVDLKGSGAAIALPQADVVAVDAGDAVIFVSLKKHVIIKSIPTPTPDSGFASGFADGMFGEATQGLVAATRGSKIYVVDTVAQELLSSFDLFESVGSLVFLNRDTIVASTDHGHVWTVDLSSGETISDISPCPSSPDWNSLSLSRVANRLLVTCKGTGVAVLFSANDLQVIRKYAPAGYFGTAYAHFSPDGRVFVASSTQVGLFDSRDGNLRLTLFNPGGGFVDANIAPTGHTVATIALSGLSMDAGPVGNGTLRIWRGSAVVPDQPLSSFSEQVDQIAISPTGEDIYVATGTGVHIQGIDGMSRGDLQSPPLELTPDHAVTCSPTLCSIWLLPSGDHLRDIAVVDTDGNVPDHVSYLPGFELFAYRDFSEPDYPLRIVDLESNRVLLTLPFGNGELLRWTPDGRVALKTSNGAGYKIQIFDPHGPPDAPSALKLDLGWDDVVAMNNQATLAIVDAANGGLSVVEVSNGHRVPLDGPRHVEYRASFLNDDRNVLLSDQSGAYLMDAATGVTISTVRLPMYLLAIAADSSWFAFVSNHYLAEDLGGFPQYDGTSLSRVNIERLGLSPEQVACETLPEGLDQTAIEAQYAFSGLQQFCGAGAMPAPFITSVPNPRP